MLSYRFLKLYKMDATTTPIAIHKLFVIVNMVLYPQFHQKSSMAIQINIFCIISIYLFSYTCVSIFYNRDDDEF